MVTHPVLPREADTIHGNFACARSSKERDNYPATMYLAAGMIFSILCHFGVLWIPLTSGISPDLHIAVPISDGQNTVRI